MQQNPWRLALGGMIALAVGIGVGRFVYTPILPVMVDALKLTTWQAGLIASSNYLGYLAGALLAALSVFRGSRRSYLLGALAVNALGLVAMGLTGDFVLQLILRFVGGVASAFILVFASALVLDQLTATGRARLSAVHFAGVGVGVAVSAAVVAALIAAGAGWQALWYVSGAMALAGFGLAALMIAPGEPPAPDLPKPAAAAAAKASSALRAMIVAYGLFGFGYVITATFIVAMVRAAPEIRAMEPYVWVLFGVSAAPSVALWMRIGARIGIVEAFAVACLVEAVGVASSILWVSTAGVIIAVVFLGGTIVSITALGLIVARRLSSGDPRPNLALMTASFGAGQAIGPAFAGWLFDWLGSFAVASLIASGALVVAAGLSMLAVGSADREPVAAADPEHRRAA